MITIIAMSLNAFPTIDYLKIIILAPSGK